jgi:DNA-binding response OmpR family regulator
MKILVLDDERDIVDVCVEFLNLHDYEADGILMTKNISEEDIFARLKSQGTEILISDQNMVGLKGTELFRCIREKPEYQKLKLILHTSEPSYELREEVLRCGGQGFLSKPIKPLALLAAVKAVCAQTA